jgi:uncharacterized membrane protein YheB (UPF0754 family)
MDEIIPYLFIAPTTAVIGWFTNWLAIKMLFYPLNFVGIGQYFGWQGIIPRLRVRLTKNLVELSIAKICTPKEVVAALDDQEAILHIQALLEPYIEDWIEDILAEQNVTAWQFTPALMKKVVFSRVKEELPKLAVSIRDEIVGKADSLVNFSDIAVAQIQDRPEFLNELFLRCAGREMRFVVMSGILFGFPLGCAQAISWYFFPHAWVLLMFGVLAGAGTNWVALKMIAHPADPVQVGPIVFQGLYLRRQQEVSGVFAEIFTTKFLTPKALLDYLWTGPKSMEVHRLVNRHVRRALDENMLSKIAAQITVTPSAFEELKTRTVEYTADRILETIDTEQARAELAKPVAALISTRMESLKPKEFQQLLLPAFEEDQMLIVLLGGVLGGAVGFAQLVWLFGY